MIRKLEKTDVDKVITSFIEVVTDALVKGEKVHSVAEIILHNKEKVVDGVLEQFLEEIAYKALPEDLVEKIEIDCGTLRLGDTIKVSDLDIAKNDKLDIQTELDTPIVSIIVSRNEASDEEEEEETEE